jgi:membrane protease subunit HflK
LPNARGQAVRQTQAAEAYQAQVIADAEGESSRFTQILREYLLAPQVTRQRMFLDTLEAVMSSSTKVIVDTEGGNNLLYLPLDQLMQQRNLIRDASEANPPTTSTNTTAPQTGGTDPASARSVRR